MQNLKNNTNESTYKTETDSQRKQIYGYQRGKRGGQATSFVNAVSIAYTIDSHIPFSKM